MAPLLIRHSLPIEPKAFPIWGARADYPEKIRVTIPEGPKQHDTGVVVAMTARALDRLLVDPQDACSFIEIHRSNLRLETHDKRGREDPKFVRDADARMIEAKFLLRGSYEANCLVALMNALGEHVALAVFVEAWVMNFAELGSMIFKRESDRWHEKFATDEDFVRRYPYGAISGLSDEWPEIVSAVSGESILPRYSRKGQTGTVETGFARSPIFQGLTPGMNVTEMEETLRTGFVRSVAEELYSPDGFFVGGWDIDSIRR